MGKLISQTGSENASPAATSFIELETAAGVSEHALLSAIRTLFKTTYDGLYQPLDAELTSLAGASANGVSLVTAANYAAMLTLLGAITASSTDTLTNKTFNADGAGNSITNIENADIKAAAAIALNKLAALTANELVVTDSNGFLTNATGVSATEAGYLNGVTSAIQTQIDTKAPYQPTGATYSPSSGAQTVALDVTSNNMHVVNGHASGTAITFTITGAANNQPFVVSILQGGTTVSTITSWFSTVRWAGGAAPTLTATLNKRDTFGFIRTGANTYDGFVIGQNC